MPVPYRISSTRQLLGELVSLPGFYASVYDHNLPSLVDVLFSWRSLAASTSYFLPAAINLRPPSVAVSPSTHTSTSNAVATNIISSLLSFNVIFYDEPTKNILVGLLDENLTEFFRLWFYNDCITNSFDKNIVWFIDFDSPCGLNDLQPPPAMPKVRMSFCAQLKVS